MYSVALSGLSFVNALVPGVSPPSVVYRALGAFSPDSNNSFYVCATRDAPFQHVLVPIRQMGIIGHYINMNCHDNSQTDAF